VEKKFNTLRYFKANSIEERPLVNLPFRCRQCGYFFSGWAARGVFPIRCPYCRMEVKERDLINPDVKYVFPYER